MNEPIQIIALNGSPHRAGNTAALMGWVAEGCQQAGALVEWIHLADYSIHYCQGCNTCLRVGVCPQQDDFYALRGKMLAADGYIAGSPVYEGGVSAQMKTFLDRLTLPALFTLTFAGKYCAGVATSGIAPTGGVAKSLSTYFGFSAGEIGAHVSTIKHGYRPLAQYHPRALPGRAQKLGFRLVRSIRSGGRGLNQLRWYWIKTLHHFFIRPLVESNPDQFGGVLAAWNQPPGR